LFDIGFQFFSAPTPTTHVWSVLLRIALYTSTIFFLVSRLTVKSSTSVVSILAHAATVLSLSELLRVITFLSTSFPGPHAYCRPDSVHYQPPSSLGAVLSPLNIPSTFSLTPSWICGDSVFSAHAMGFVLCALIVSWHTRSQVARWGIWTLAFACSATLVAIRVNYSLDVFVAWFSVVLVWLGYYAMVKGGHKDYQAIE
jgi:hypothetical protein